MEASINFEGVECYNEKVAGSGRTVLKAACSRTSKEPFCESEGGDAELLLCIPFSADVRLKSLCVSGGEAAGTSPLRVKLFCNTRHDILEAAEAPATQEITFTTPDAAAELWHSLKVAKFTNCSHLQLYFSGRLGNVSGSGGEGDLRIYYIGLKADVGAPRIGVVHAVYESRAQLSNHKSSSELAGGGSTLK